MTIQEAIRSGKPFKRHLWKMWWVPSDGATQIFREGASQWNPLAEVVPGLDDILATDWEVKP